MNLSRQSLPRLPLFKGCLAGLVLTALSGCMITEGESPVTRLKQLVERIPGMQDNGPGAGAETVSRFDAAPDTATNSGLAPEKAAEISPIIAALQARPTALVPNSAYDRIAQAVLASDSRVAEAELRVARLRSEAADKNWLPRIGPRVSLTSLADFVVGLVVEQVVFDNGRKKAERALAKADVEIAAVRLVEDGNARVHDALTLYLAAEENRALQAHLNSALIELTRFSWVMQQRVDGGVSDRSDLNVLNQKTADLRARRDASGEAIQVALAELEAMAGHPLDSVTGLGGTQALSPGPALEVLRAEAERDLALAEAVVARAGHLPGVAVTAEAGNGPTDFGIELRTDSLFGLGTAAELQAIEASRETAERRIAETREQALRAEAVQRRQRDAFLRQAQEARGLTQQAAANLDLFRRQYQAGQRQVMDVVGVYETYARAMERQISLTYSAERAELDLARQRGALVAGRQI